MTVDFNTGIATGEPTSTEWFTVQPNPSNGVFQLLPSATTAGPIQVFVRNGLGQDVLTPFTVAGRHTISMDLGGMASGAYYLLATRNGEQHIMKLLVQQ